MSDPDCFVCNGSLLSLFKCQEEKAIRESVGKSGLFGEIQTVEKDVPKRPKECGILQSSKTIIGAEAKDLSIAAGRMEGRAVQVS